MNKTELSVIIVSFNTKDILKKCLESLIKIRDLDFEIIVSDNGSSDGSVEMVSSEFGKVKLIENGKNLGFAKGNNAARKYVKSDYVLFLNSDTVVNRSALVKTVDYLKTHDDVGSVTCKIVLPSGQLDRDTRRRFPTPLVSLKRLFLGSVRDYWYLDIASTKIHEVDVIQGAFHLTRKKILDEVDWFDEDYFLDGEDIDLCWKIKQVGYKIVYYPKVSIIHIKKASKEAQKSSFAVTSGIKAMEIFYRKRLWSRYPFFINYLVIFGIKILFVVRLIKFYLR
ncbi:hypothetical protein A2803_03755 [Candidatus Woesebacteria bacterium RIFCSPHIGHO2_01_FULL_44_21]|uniref:Glycosyltransferase 2-like domain-containing protein n=1 Tax=Candidatus Woesebacteria bacterium RIFCSPHIGHO2_01_FULL_44_21 TaxID=1802503 RepID=A0A1F7YVC6_9BACT|nr:MAG: hypothetical protein A2803_03755 [Candidatus Woesebacteria bacterium RIFCSPHIGHO2_01_FULL_44_21]